MEEHWSSKSLLLTGGVLAVGGTQKSADVRESTTALRLMYKRGLEVMVLTILGSLLVLRLLAGFTTQWRVVDRADWCWCRCRRVVDGTAAGYTVVYGLRGVGRGSEPRGRGERCVS